MNKKIMMISIWPPIYFPRDFFGGQMHSLVIILDPDTWPWKILSYGPSVFYRKKPGLTWLKDIRPLATELNSPILASNYDIVWQMEASPERFKKFLRYWNTNNRSQRDQVKWISTEKEHESEENNS